MTYYLCKRHLEPVHSGQSEIGKFELAIAWNKNILWFQVSMNDTIGMKKVYPSQELLH